MPKLLRNSLLLLLFVSVQTTGATSNSQAQFSSGELRVAMIELFTSEGCSSCPPADRWLSKLKSDPDLWKAFTPIAFHVDYWDYIGWKDEFSSAEFSDRQRRYIDEGGADVVYTPGFFRNGSEWRDWQRGDEVGIDNDVAGQLSLAISGADVAARFDPMRARNDELQIHIALLGMNIETQVRAGENSGKTLHHDFVALQVISESLEIAGGGYKAVVELPKILSDSNDHAIAAWVTNNTHQAPIQSVGGLLSSH